jgi:hypothetical protein
MPSVRSLSGAIGRGERVGHGWSTQIWRVCLRYPPTGIPETLKGFSGREPKEPLAGHAPPSPPARRCRLPVVKVFPVPGTPAVVWVCPRSVPCREAYRGAVSQGRATGAWHATGSGWDFILCFKSYLCIIFAIVAYWKHIFEAVILIQ